MAPNGRIILCIIFECLRRPKSWTCITSSAGKCENDKMNLNVHQAGGSVLVVSQFTLAADTRKGMRPSFSGGAVPAEAERLYNVFSDCCRASGITTASGRT
ncbi:hypothetical protein CRX72_29705 [Pantoea sp. BRM17]|nr:hypothetical protein CRX72_29705 [Pantoea sp. BRM17]